MERTGTNSSNISRSLSVPYRKMSPNTKSKYEKEKKRRYRSVSSNRSVSLKRCVGRPPLYQPLTSKEIRDKCTKRVSKCRNRQKTKEQKQKASLKRWYPEELISVSNNVETSPKVQLSDIRIEKNPRFGKK